MTRPTSSARVALLVLAAIHVTGSARAQVPGGSAPPAASSAPGPAAAPPPSAAPPAGPAAPPAASAPPPGSAAPPPATPPPPAATDEDAIRRFKDGRRLLEEGKFDEALVELRASFEKLPSPNTELLIGHALRLTNRRAEAAMVYRRVIASAGEKVRGGEERFRPTLEEAGRLEATLRAQLVELDVVVSGAPVGTTVVVGADTLEVASDARGVTAKALHEAGPLTVIATAPDGRTVRKDIDTQPGGQAAVLLELPAVEGPKPKVVEASTEGGLDIPPPPLASWIAGGVGVAGLAVFGIFGAMSSSAASDLDECSPSCPDALRDTADGGATQQTVANVGLVFGALGLATAGVLWVVWPEDEPTTAGLGAPPPGATPPRAALQVSPVGRADVLVTF